jgi:hypothetical protein
MSETLIGTPNITPEQPAQIELAKQPALLEQGTQDVAPNSNRGWEYDLAVGEGHDVEGVTKDEFENMSPEQQDQVLGNFRD